MQRVKTWQLVILFLLMSLVSATFLRLNNIGMIERRSAVITADNAGNDDKTKDRLYDLQHYVTAHMNTSMGKGVYLEASYKRDVQAAYEKVANYSNVNGNIYKKVQEVCEPRFTHWSYAYVQCVQNEAAKYSEGSDWGSVEKPPTSLYLHVYASPLWSPDFAGWSVLICVVILIMIIVRLTSVVILKIVLRLRHKSI